MPKPSAPKPSSLLPSPIKEATTKSRKPRGGRSAALPLRLEPQVSAASKSNSLLANGKLQFTSAGHRSDLACRDECQAGLLRLWAMAPPGDCSDSLGGCERVSPRLLHGPQRTSLRHWTPALRIRASWISSATRAAFFRGSTRFDEKIPLCVSRSTPGNREEGAVCSHRRGKSATPLTAFHDKSSPSSIFSACRPSSRRRLAAGRIFILRILELLHPRQGLRVSELVGVLEDRR